MILMACGLFLRITYADHMHTILKPFQQSGANHLGIIII